jgi:hypothetical protein
MLIPGSPQRRYLASWTNSSGTDNGWDGHIMSIWPGFWRKYHSKV